MRVLGLGGGEGVLGLRGSSSSFLALGLALGFDLALGFGVAGSIGVSVCFNLFLIFL